MKDINSLYLSRGAFAPANGDINSSFGLGNIFKSSVNYFSPTYLPNLALWLDASDSRTITEVLGKVSEWRDKSGSNNHAIQGTELNQPKIEDNHIAFNGTNTCMMLPNSINDISNMTIFVVADTLVGGTRGYILSSSILNRMYFGKGDLNGAYVRTNSSTMIFDGDMTGKKTIMLTQTNASTKLYINGTLDDEKSQTSTGESTSLTIGSFDGTSSWYSGNIMEMGIYDRVLSEDEMSKLNNYLKDKWGV